MPSRPCEGEDYCASLPLHAHCLFKLGVYLGEIWHLSDLVQRHLNRPFGRFRTGYDRVILDMNERPDAAVLSANPGAGLGPSPSARRGGRTVLSW